MVRSKGLLLIASWLIGIPLAAAFVGYSQIWTFWKSSMVLGVGVGGWMLFTGRNHLK